jgi:hypothetical protein
MIVARKFTAPIKASAPSAGEQRVHADPLLHYGEHERDPERLPHARLKELADRAAFELDRLAQAADRHARFEGSGGALQYRAGLLFAALLHQPARALRDEEHRDQQKQRRQGGDGEHPAPALVTKKRQAPVGEIGEQDTGDDRHLVEGDELAADARGRDFGDIERGEEAGRTDRESAPQASEQESARHAHDMPKRQQHGERRADRRESEQSGRQQERLPAAPTVAKRAGEGRADDATGKQAAGGDLSPQFGEVPQGPEVDDRAADDGNVEAEQQPRSRSHGRNEGDEDSASGPLQIRAGPRCGRLRICVHRV